MRLDSAVRHRCSRRRPSRHRHKMNYTTVPPNNFCFYFITVMELPRLFRRAHLKKITKVATGTICSHPALKTTTPPIKPRTGIYPRGPRSTLDICLVPEIFLINFNQSYCIILLSSPNRPSAFNLSPFNEIILIIMPADGLITFYGD